MALVGRKEREGKGKAGGSREGVRREEMKQNRNAIEQNRAE